MRRVVVAGAAGRDFHDFQVVLRDDPDVEVVAFTATQIPGIDDRRFPASLAGPRYPSGIPIRPETELESLIAEHEVDEVVFAYSDVPHEHVMHLASRALAGGADLRIIGPRASQLISPVPVVAVTAVRTGCGKSQTTRRIGELLLEAGLRPVLVRHPMPYGDLEAMRVQRFATLADIDASDPTIEEREEYEAPVRAGLILYAGVDYAAILAEAAAEADVLIWDGGNNDLPFFRPDLHLVVADPLRPGHERRYHPGEANLRRADVVVLNKVDVASPEAIREVLDSIAELNPQAPVVQAASPVTLEPGPSLVGRRVLVVEDGPTITHGGMPFGAGTTAARHAGASHIVDPRAHAAGSLRATYAAYPGIGPVLPAMGYSAAQIADLSATIHASGCEVVIAGTPIDLGRLLDVEVPVRRVTYELREVGEPTLAQVLAPILRGAQR